MTIILRKDKGSPLTYDELDGNFESLDSDVQVISEIEGLPDWDAGSPQGYGNDTPDTGKMMYLEYSYNKGLVPVWTQYAQMHIPSASTYFGTATLERSRDPNLHEENTAIG